MVVSGYLCRSLSLSLIPSVSFCLFLSPSTLSYYITNTNIIINCYQKDGQALSHYITNYEPIILSFFSIINLLFAEPVYIIGSGSL